MTPPFCNVALPVPLRTTFTYAVPESLRGTVQPGSRVLVPFRKKAMVGVVVELAESIAFFRNGTDHRFLPERHEHAAESDGRRRRGIGGERAAGDEDS